MADHDVGYVAELLIHAGCACYNLVSKRLFICISGGGKELCHVFIEFL
jgi:hypothetical protein